MPYRDINSKTADEPKSTTYNLTRAIMGSANTILKQFRPGVGHRYISHSGKWADRLP
jgi:hypothetical protein